MTGCDVAGWGLVALGTLLCLLGLVLAWWGWRWAAEARRSLERARRREGAALGLLSEALVHHRLLAVLALVVQGQDPVEQRRGRAPDDGGDPGPEREPRDP